ncbi:MAG: Rieske 2Fe-2S domain-containing protein [Candidatus Caldarchaeum sp.]
MAKAVKVATASELPPGDMKTFDVEGKLILVANVDGVYYAMDAICSHEEWDLSEGMLEDTRVTCAGHGAVWDLRTGTAEFDEELPPLKTYKTLLKDGEVFIEIE